MNDIDKIISLESQIATLKEKNRAMGYGLLYLKRRLKDAAEFIEDLAGKETY